MSVRKDVRTEQLVAAHRAGMPRKEIAAKFGLHYTTVIARLRKAGVVLPTKSTGRPKTAVCGRGHKWADPGVERRRPDGSRYCGECRRVLRDEASLGL